MFKIVPTTLQAFNDTIQGIKINLSQDLTKDTVFCKKKIKIKNEELNSYVH